ncbi:ABC transporter ATP-binding protein [Streptomyces sp. SL54]|uniref:ABC transporter ATP-binding protein n=1 Tax=Streptantibioticus silvisoli TaxID=2705255 RepID=A0ABT6W7Y0_9ACTN|nr:ABC transporter ATP-binding protein [Streptantibioticus silvisoli]
MVRVEGLTVDFPVGDGVVRAVDGLDFTLGAGEALGIVGESGSGKSTVAYALLGLHSGTGARTGGTATVAGVDALRAGGDDLRRLRGELAAMVFQDPLSALDPYFAIGDQIAEVVRAHRRVSRRAARARAVEVLDRVRIPDAARRSRSRPHEFSGGMRQRALIAMALACEPRLIVADEPTTALDVTVQAQILDLLHEVRADTGAGLLLVTHDLGVVAGSVDHVLVMKDGRAVERGPVTQVLTAPRGDYAKALLSAVPRLDGEVAPGGAVAPGAQVAGGAVAPDGAVAPGGAVEPDGEVAPGGAVAPGAQVAGGAVAPGGAVEQDGAIAPGGAVSGSGSGSGGAVSGSGAERVPAARDGGTGPGGGGEPLLEVVDLRREFGRRGAVVHAVDGVSLTVGRGETLGVVGESGSGKTTLGRMLVRLLEPTSGVLRFEGRDIGGLRERELRPLRGALQMVFQDPVSSLNPRRSIGESIADPLRALNRSMTDRQVRSRVESLLDRVGLDPQWYHRYPHEFSGGQRQRVGIARALAPKPRLVVCDEPVSALDVTTQAHVVELLDELRRDLGLSLVFIAHDLAVVRQVSDRVAVMRAGRIVEEGPAERVYRSPQHPYTRQLLDAVPVLDPAGAADRRAARREAAATAAAR